MTTTDANSLWQRRPHRRRIIVNPRRQAMTNSAGPAAVGLPKNLVRLATRTMGPGSRIQVVRRLPVGQLASANECEVPTLFLTRLPGPPRTPRREQVFVRNFRAIRDEAAE